MESIVEYREENRDAISPLDLGVICTLLMGVLLG